MAQRTARITALCVLAIIPRSAFAQSNQVMPQRDTQIWGDLQAAHSLRENTDLLLYGALRLGRDGRHPVYERVGAGLSFRLGKYITLSPIYSYVASQPGAGQDNRENRISLDPTVVVPVGRWSVSDRNGIEMRFRELKDSTRYRNRVRLERQIQLANTLFTVFAWDEVLYDWSFNAWVRNRLAIGGRKSLNSKVSLEFYYLRQNGSYIRPADLHALGMTLRTRF